MARYATSSGISLKLVGTQTAPSRNAANIDQNISSQFLEWTRTRSPLPMPRAASAAASDKTRASISRQVHDLSPQTKPTRSPCRRAFCGTRCARFMTRRDIGVTPPDGAAAVMASPVIPSHPYACRDHGKTRHTRGDAVLGVQARDVNVMSGKEARQLIRRHQEIDAGHREQEHAEHGQYKLHGWILLE